MFMLSSKEWWKFSCMISANNFSFVSDINCCLHYMLHDGTYIYVVFTENGHEFLFCLSRRCKWLHVSNIARGCPFVIHPRGMRICHHILWNIGPKLSSFLPSSLYPIQHLVWINTTIHCHPALLSVYLHIFT